MGSGACGRCRSPHRAPGFGRAMGEGEDGHGKEYTRTRRCRLPGVKTPVYPEKVATRLKNHRPQAYPQCRRHFLRLDRQFIAGSTIYATMPPNAASAIISGLLRLPIRAEAARRGRPVRLCGRGACRASRSRLASAPSGSSASVSSLERTASVSRTISLCSETVRKLGFRAARISVSRRAACCSDLIL